MPSSAARRRVITNASRLATSSLRSSRVMSRIGGTNPSSRLRRPLTGSPCSGSQATIWISGRCSFRRAEQPIRVPPVPRPATKTSSSGQSRTISARRALVVGPRVGGVAVLERHEHAVLGREALGDLDGPVGAVLAVGRDDLRAVEPQQRLALLGDVLGHDGHQPVALDPADHRQGDAGIARGRLHDRVPGRDQPALLGVVDQRLRGAVLDRAGRVVALELDDDPHTRIRRDVRQLDHRRVANGAEHVGSDRHRAGDADFRGHRERYRAVAPPAMAGRISRVSASLTGVSSHSCRRTSSSLT